MTTTHTMRLTWGQIAASTETTAYGIAVTTTDDGDVLLIGSHDHRRLVAALSAHTRQLHGQTLRERYEVCPVSCTSPVCAACGHTQLRITPWWAIAIPDGDGDWDLIPMPDPTPGTLLIATILS